MDWHKYALYAALFAALAWNYHTTETANQMYHDTMQLVQGVCN